MDEKQVELIITGLVQGVFYRASAQEKAKELGVTGWARNNQDGSVTILAQGDEAQLSQIISWCWDGPDGAHVDDIVEEWQELEEKLEIFEIHYA